MRDRLQQICGRGDKTHSIRMYRPGRYGCGCSFLGMGHTSPTQNGFCPTGRYHLRVQHLTAKSANFKSPSHTLFSQPKRQDRNIVRPPRHLCLVPQPTGIVLRFNAIVCVNVFIH